MLRCINFLTLVFFSNSSNVELKAMLQGFADFSECLGSLPAQLIDVFPFIKHLPEILLPVKRRARELHEKERELYIGHWLAVKQKIQSGTANVSVPYKASLCQLMLRQPCICMDLANSQNTQHFSDALAGYISGSLLEAGSDTTYSTLVGWVQAMLLFPEVAKTAQEELDRVCGDHFPTLEDEPNLQYVRGCVKESMRWMPTAIVGVPHAVIRDDEYKGYRIPKGAAVLWNVW